MIALKHGIYSGNMVDGMDFQSLKEPWMKDLKQNMPFWI